MRTVQLNEEIKSYTKTINGLSVLNISTYSKNILYFLFDYQYLPLSEEQLKKRGKVNREFTDKMIYTSLNINYRTYSKSINELVAAGYLTISDDLMMLNISKMMKDIHTINTTQIMPILKKGKINELEGLIIEKDKKYFQKLEKMVVAGIADEDEIKEYNELKTLLHGSDDKEVNEQETITNITKETKAEKQDATIEVEETQKEADLDVEREIEHKDTTSTLEAENTAKTEQKEVIKEDTSNDINKYKNLFNELNSFQIKNNDEIIETSDKKFEDDNIKKIKTNEMVTQENFKMINELALLEGKEEVAFKIKEFTLKNKFSNEYYQNEALSRFLKGELEKHTIYKEVEEMPLNTLKNDKSKVIMHTKEDAIKYLVEKYGENLKETLEKEFDEFLEFTDDIKYIFNTLNYKYGKRVA